MGSDGSTWCSFHKVLSCPAIYGLAPTRGALPAGAGPHLRVRYAVPWFVCVGIVPDTLCFPGPPWLGGHAPAVVPVRVL